MSMAMAMMDDMMVVMLARLVDVLSFPMTYLIALIWRGNHRSRLIATMLNSADGPSLSKTDKTAYPQSTVS